MTRGSTDRSPVVAAGCLIWRVRSGRLEVLMVHRPRYGDWSWPKGKLEVGEGAAACAVREVVEEAGLDVVLGAPLSTLEYRLVTGRAKQVRYWAARAVGPAEEPTLRARGRTQAASPDEVDEVCWVRAGQARRRLTHLKDRVPLDELAARFRAGTLSTRAVVIVRHAQAVSREEWVKDGGGREEGRPLTGQGKARAERLVPLLSAFGVVRLVTSPWKRCRATLKPYAKATGLRRRVEEALAEDTACEKPNAALRVLGRELSRPGPASALCVHRPTLPVLLAEVSRSCVETQSVRAAIPGADPYLATAEALVAHVAQRGSWRGRAVAVETLTPS